MVEVEQLRQQNQDLFKRRLDEHVALLEADAGQHAENILDLQRFLKHLTAQSIGYRRQKKYFEHFKTLFAMFSKPLRYATAEELEGLAVAIKERPAWSEWTKHDYLVTLKKFFSWLDGENLERVKMVKVPNVKQARVPEYSVLSQQEVRDFAAAAKNIRVQAEIEFLYLSAAAAGEFTGMDVSDVQLQEPFLLMKLKGTKNSFREREVPIRLDEHALNLFKQYMAQHPFKDNPRAPLWVNSQGERLQQRTIYKTLEKLAQETRLTKPWNPHWFRHSRLSELSNYLSDQQLKQYAGWSPNSDMAGVYVHGGVNSLMRALLDKFPMKPKQAAEAAEKKFWNDLKKDKKFMDTLFDRAVERGLLPTMQELNEHYADALHSREGLGRSELFSSASAESPKKVLNARKKKL